MNEPTRVNIPEWTVSELSVALRKTVEDAFGYVRVRGEISGFRGPLSSGHCYFVLKDEGAADARGRWRFDDRLLPHGAGKRICGAAARRHGTQRFDLHGCESSLR